MSDTVISQPTLLICTTCGSKVRDENGVKVPNPVAEQLSADVTALLDGSEVAVRMVRCLSMCDYPIGWALQGEGRFTFAFAPASTAADLAATAKAYAAQAVGEKLGKKDMPPEVAKSLRSRIPPLG